MSFTSNHSSENFFIEAQRNFNKLKSIKIEQREKIPKEWIDTLNYDYGVDDDNIDFALRTLASSLTGLKCIPLEIIKVHGCLTVKIENQR